MSDAELIALWKARLRRTASRVVFTSQTAADGGLYSWFGHVTHAPPGATWPTYRGQLMWPLLQVIVPDLPYCPESVRDLAFISAFAFPDLSEADIDNGEGWAVHHAYRLKDVVPLAEPQHDSWVRPCRLGWEYIPEDYPSYDDLPDDFPEHLRGDNYHEDFRKIWGTKVGGWPANIQSEVYWAPLNRHPYAPEYVFEIDTEPDRDWGWGCNGTCYFGRGTGAHRDQWAMSWQGY